MNTKRIVHSLLVSAMAAGLSATAFAKDFVQDAEYYVLKAQHGDKWAAEDKELNKPLAELEKKFATPPTILHIMWDDTP